MTKQEHEIEEADVEVINEEPKTNGSLVVSEPLQLIPLEQMKKWYDTFSEFTKSILKPGLDFGTIPGVSKPSLFKPGAEKLRFAYQLGSEFKLVDKSEDFVLKFFDYTYRCTIKDRSGRILAQCEGNCSSEETKYKYSFKPNYDLKPSKEEADKLKAEKKGKQIKLNGNWVWHDRVENPEIASLRNTLMKMAQKRAFVGAMLLATGASEFFTQDVEDMDIQETAFNIDEFNPRKDKVHFGKHEGKTWGEVPHDYLKWLSDNAKDENTKQMVDKTLKECYSENETTRDDIVGDIEKSIEVEEYKKKINACTTKKAVQEIKKEIDGDKLSKDQKSFLMKAINEKINSL